MMLLLTLWKLYVGATRHTVGTSLVYYVREFSFFKAKNVEEKCSADNAIFYCSGLTPKEAIRTLHLDLNVILEAYSSGRPVLNEAKSQAMLFPPSRRKVDEKLFASHQSQRLYFAILKFDGISRGAARFEFVI